MFQSIKYRLLKGKNRIKKDINLKDNEYILNGTYISVKVA